MNESLAQITFDTKNESGAGFEHTLDRVVYSLRLPDRFFLATILAGRLHPNGIPEWGPWETSRLYWWSEDHLDKILATTMARKVRTVEGLEAAIKEPMRVAPTRIIWIHESLEDEARSMWELGRR